MTLKSILLAVTALVASASTFAAQGNHGDAYAVADVGFSHQSSAVSGLQDRAAWSATLGVQFKDNFAIETSYHDFGSRSYVLSGTTVHSKWTAVSLGLVQGFPMSRDVTAFGKVSLAQTATSGPVVLGAANVKTFSTGLTVGGGFDYRIDKYWDARFAYEAFPNFAESGQTMHNLSAGLRFQW